MTTITRNSAGHTVKMPDCQRCADTGWAFTDEKFILQFPLEQQEAARNAVYPCDCASGADVRVGHIASRGLEQGLKPPQTPYDRKAASAGRDIA